ncbi:MAG: ABC transporter ATP-binding protein [Sphingomonadaceae bacterium]
MNIAVKNVSLTLGRSSVLRAINCVLTPGRVTAIIGPNGAGKTSLIRVIAGLVTPQSGRVSLDGTDLSTSDRTQRARQIGYLPQVNQPHWNVTARALISLGRLPHRSAFARPSPSDEAAIMNAMERTNTAHLADRTIDQMSGGERARVQLARVIAGDADWILADEPLANLDPPHARDVLGLLAQSARQGKGVAIILHQLNAAADCADDVIIMRTGTIVAAGATADVLTPLNLAAAYDMNFDVFSKSGRLIVAPSAV